MRLEANSTTNGTTAAESATAVLYARPNTPEVVVAPETHSSGSTPKPSDILPAAEYAKRHDLDPTVVRSDIRSGRLESFTETGEPLQYIHMAPISRRGGRFLRRRGTSLTRLSEVYEDPEGNRFVLARDWERMHVRLSDIYANIYAKKDQESREATRRALSRHTHSSATNGDPTDQTSLEEGRLSLPAFAETAGMKDEDVIATIIEGGQVVFDAQGRALDSVNDIRKFEAEVKKGKGIYRFLPTRLASAIVKPKLVSPHLYVSIDGVILHLKKNMDHIFLNPRPSDNRSHGHRRPAEGQPHANGAIPNGRTRMGAELAKRWAGEQTKAESSVRVRNEAASPRRRMGRPTITVQADVHANDVHYEQTSYLLGLPPEAYITVTYPLPETPKDDSKPSVRTLQRMGRAWKHLGNAVKEKEGQVPYSK